MKKLMQWIILGVMGLVLAGCAGGISKEAKESVGWSDAPQWVVDGHDGDYSAVGDAPIIDKNVQFARSEATASARGELAKRIEAMVSTNLTKEGVRMDSKITEKVSNEVKEFAQRNMQGIGVEKTWIDDKGTRIYILVRLNKGAQKDLQSKLAKQFENLTPSQILPTQE